MAPAIRKLNSGAFHISTELYESEAAAKRDDAFFYSWPALIDKETGMYIVPTKENV